jgi:hypothetical protein
LENRSFEDFLALFMHSPPLEGDMPMRRNDDRLPRNMMGRVFGGENFAGEGGPVEWMPSDEHLIEQVVEKFTHHPVLDGNSIVVSSQEGIVGLRGYVRSHEAKALAEGLARSVSGVSSVHNEIQVKGGRVS